MELLGPKQHNVHTRQLPGRWTPFQNLLTRGFLSTCTKCTTDSIRSEFQYDVLPSNAVASSVTPQARRAGQYCNTVNTNHRNNQEIDQQNHETELDSCFTSSRAVHNQLDQLIFSPGRRSQLTRQQLTWMQALASNINDTPPSLRDAALVYSSGSNSNTDDTDSEQTRLNSNDNNVHPDATSRSQRAENRTLGNASHIDHDNNFALPSPNLSGKDNTMGDRISITSRLLPDPSSDSGDGSLLQATTVEVYSFQNENTMFNFDEQNIVEADEALKRNEAYCDEFGDIFRNMSDEETYNTARDDPIRSFSPASFPYPYWQETEVPTESQHLNEASAEMHGARLETIRNVTSHFPQEDAHSFSEESNVDTATSLATEETEVGTSQESAEESVTLDFSENFTLNELNSTNQQNNLLIIQDSQTGGDENRNSGEADLVEPTVLVHEALGNEEEAVSERNLPMHLISLFENPTSSSGSSDCGTQTETVPVENSSPVDTVDPNIDLNNSAFLASLSSAHITGDSRNRWATRIIRSNLTRQANNSQTVCSNTSSGSVRPQLQNWYVYDPRLVPGNRAAPRLALDVQYQGVQGIWSLPALIEPPQYEAHQPGEAPPPYPPPSYDEAVFDSHFDDNTLATWRTNPMFAGNTLSRNNLLNSNVTLPSEVLEQLENVLNMNSSPHTSPRDTLTSCCSDTTLTSHQSNDCSNSSSRQSINSTNQHGISGISSIPTSLQRNQSQQNPLLDNRPNTDISDEQLRSLRSALGNRLRDLHESTLNQPTVQETNTEAHLYPRSRSLGSTQRGSSNIEPFFNRPAIMWNRQVWSVNQSRQSLSHFTLGGRLGVHNTNTADVSGLHL